MNSIELHDSIVKLFVHNYDHFKFLFIACLLQTPPPQKKMVAILPTLRVNSYAHPTVGSHTATQDGVYEILFDNSYSRYIFYNNNSY